MTTPDPRPLLAALSDLSDEALRRVAVAGMRLVKDHPEDPPILSTRGWHALAALAAEVEAERRQIVDELERSLDDCEIGGIVADDDSEPDPSCP